MSSAEQKKQDWKAKFRRELVEYGFNVVYLTLVFAAFTVYRRLVLAAHDITYTNYWVAVIEALILGKVIMIGGVFHLGRGLEEKPLIYPTLYKTLVFTVFVAVFKLVEHAVKGLWQGHGLMGGLAEFSDKGIEVVIANSLVVLVAFLPFFAVKELSRVLGEKKVWTLFFRQQTPP
jgi:hypothetical protein